MFWILFVSCDQSKSQKVACEKKVTEFRELVKKREFSRIYDDTSSAFRLGTGENNLEKALQGYEDEIGLVENFNNSRWTTHFDLKDGTVFILVYECESCAKVKSDEYMFVKEDNGFALFNYRFDSKTN